MAFSLSSRPLSRPDTKLLPRLKARLRVCVSFQNPYSTLGVSAASDDKEIKRAYRKLALEWHPDVSKKPEAAAVFLQLTEAYEFLTGKHDGKEMPDHTGAPDFAFHDWYWSFKAERTWNKNKESSDPSQAKPNRTSAQAAEKKETIRSQLAGLRHRAAVRSTKAMTRDQPCSSEASEDFASTPCSGEASEEYASKPCPGEASKDYASKPYSGEASEEDASNATEEADPSTPSGWNGLGPQATAPVNEADSTSVPEGPATEEDTAEQVLEACSDQVEASDNAAPSSGPGSAKFVAHSGTRDQVFSQLAGLRRKAAIMSKA